MTAPTSSSRARDFPWSIRSTAHSAASPAPDIVCCLLFNFRTLEAICQAWGQCESVPSPVRYHPQSTKQHAKGFMRHVIPTLGSIKLSKLTARQLQKLFNNVREHEKHPDSPYLFASPRTGDMYHPDSIANSTSRSSSAQDRRVSACTISDIAARPCC